jgi:hypothetical protein
MIYISVASKKHEIHTSGPARKCKKHMRHICPAQPAKSALAKHIYQTGHNIDFSSISILDNMQRCPLLMSHRNTTLIFTNLLIDIIIFT